MSGDYMHACIIAKRAAYHVVHHAHSVFEEKTSSGLHDFKVPSVHIS